MPKYNPLPFDELAQRAKAQGINVPIDPSRERYLSPPDVARILNVTPPSVFHWINQARLPAAKTANGRWHISVADLEKFIRTRNDNSKRRVVVAGTSAEAMSEIVQAIEALGHQVVVPSNYTDTMLKSPRAVHHRRRRRQA